MQSKTNKLTIYMIKPEHQNFNEVVDTLQEGRAIGDIGVFYSEESHPHIPGWIKDFFGVTLGDGLGITVSSAKGMLLTSIMHEDKKILFAVSFGFGRFLLKKETIEERFGLKVVLNSVDPKSLRSIDKTSLGSVLKHTREQITRDGIAADFGIDIEQDLVNSVTGRSKDEKLGNRITGRDALSVSVKVDVNNIKDFLKHCLDRYKSTDYKQDFAWIDQITDIRSIKQVNELNRQLLEKLNSKNFDNVWMAVPEVVDWVDIQGFRYLQQMDVDLKDDIDVQDFIAACGGGTIDIDRLESSFIHVISSKKDQVIESWSAFDCIYAELEYEGKICVLNNGKWYEIVKDFTQQVKEEFQNIDRSSMTFPQYNHGNENEYNKEAATQIPNACCMDKEVVVHGGGHSKVEFCDLLTKDKKIIHVKKYGGSSHLSHLFSQGVVSGELFAADKEFRQKLNDKLPPDYKLADYNARPDANNYEVVYGIISDSKKSLDIPFFSKVTLRNAHRRLAGYGYQVSIKKIERITPQGT